MGLVEHDDVIQALSPNGAHKSFAVWILPRRPRRNRHFFDAHSLDACLEIVPVDSIAIT